MGLVQRRRRRTCGDETLTLYLASLSPRRAQLMKEAGIRYRILKVPYKEIDPPGLGPARIARKHALGKAMAAAAKIKSGRVLAADTLVYFKGRIIGKPRTMREAEKTLLSLQGKWHEVYTGVALLEVRGSGVERKALFCETTKVKLKAMTLPQIRRYFRHARPLDKAGAYAIQSRSGGIVEKVLGSFSNAVGLPMEQVCARMKKL